MPGKKTYLLLIVSLLISMVIMASASGWKGPLSQMDMPTATSSPATTQSVTEPTLQDTPAQQVNPPASKLGTPTPTSIFTGYTPYPTGMGVGNSSMGSCGAGCGTGSSAGMSGMGSMGGTPMVNSTAMNGMGSMGSSSMSMSCPMMSGSGMTSMGSGDDLLMSGMDMDEVSSSTVYGTNEESVNPWTILGWVVLGLVVAAIIAALVLGIILLIKQARQAPPA
jgi:hypothetical protein